MHVDDRLATVLQQRATGERASRTQLRQLLDLLGGASGLVEGEQLDAAWERLRALEQAIPAAERAAMIREPGMRLRNPRCIAMLAEGEAEVAAAALAGARLDDAQWEDLIPALPVRARGFLRFRRDLPPRAVAMLDRLGVQDRALPRPPLAPAQPASRPVPPRPANDLAAPTPVEGSPGDGGIAALVRRIEAFRQARTTEAEQDSPRAAPRARGEAVRLPPLASIAFTTDRRGAIDWADADATPMLAGTMLASADRPGLHRAMAVRRPIERATVLLDGADRIAGEWQVDALPRFGPDGQFQGYAGQMRRAPSSAGGAQDDADRIRQLLHELRTPVNAIQGFAEVIQQQIFGPAPHEYRALAAAIAGDAARILAGFDELDRLARLEAGALTPEPGECDLAPILSRQLARLQPVLQPRMATFEETPAPGPLPVAIAAGEAEHLLWRMLAAIAGTVAPGETLSLSSAAATGQAEIAIDLPAALAVEDDPFAADIAGGSAVLRAGMFGAGFALRLARAEARAAGGDLKRHDDTLRLILPLLTEGDPAHSHGETQHQGSGPR